MTPKYSVFSILGAKAQNDETLNVCFDAPDSPGPCPFRLGLAIPFSRGYSTLGAQGIDCFAAEPDPCPSLDVDNFPLPSNGLSGR